MRISRRTARILLALCLLVLQAQLFAASVLGCGHALDAAPDEQAVSACPFHQASGDQAGGQDSDRLLGCQKCALHCAIGVHGPVAAAIDIKGKPVKSALEVLQHRHFYSFSPDPFLKPPIS